MRLPIPDFSFKSISEISADFLQGQGIELLLLDLDNTMARYSEPVPSESLLSWIAGLKSAGVRLFIVSNNRSDRAKNFSQALDIDYINRAKKPSPKGLIVAMERCCIEPEHTAMIGDQIYTDVAAGKGCGVKTIVVRPISLKNPLLAVRYFAEFPFRLARKLKG